MSVLIWDQTGEHLYETGTKKAVLYPFDNTIPAFDATKTSYAKGDKVVYNGDVYVCKTAISQAGAWTPTNWDLSSAYSPGVAWNGITAITESPSGADETALYADDQKYLSLRAAEEFGATIEAYMYPDEWMECDGSASLVRGVTIGQQKRKSFGLSFETIVGNDTETNDYGTKIHLIYGATASPSERAYQTVNDSPEAITFSWELSTVPVEVKSASAQNLDYKKTANVIIDTTKLTADQKKSGGPLSKLLDAIRGTSTTDAYLPSPGQIYDWFNVAG